MWQAVADKLRQLQAIDRKFQAFGAEVHRYCLRPPLSSAATARVERQLGVALPEELRRFYTEIGDGGAGPCYGLKPAHELGEHRPSLPYPGVEALRAMADQHGSPLNKDYFEAPREALAGLLAVIEHGCGHQSCLITSGPRTGRVVDVNWDGYVVETDQTLVDLYQKWLDDEIARFDAVKTLMGAGKSFREIQDQMIARFGAYDAGDRIVSIADVRKPPALFGEGGVRRVYGAIQFPWYDGILREWQRRHLPAPPGQH